MPFNSRNGHAQNVVDDLAGMGNICPTQIGPLPQTVTRKVGKIPTCFSRFFRINTCDHVLDHWATIPSGISNVCNFEDLHKSRANRLARRGNIARVSDQFGQRADLCSQAGP